MRMRKDESRKKAMRAKRWEDDRTGLELTRKME